MPKNAQDAAAAQDLVALGPDELAPVVPEMLRNLKHYQSPVAVTYCAFFATQGERFADQIIEMLNRSTMPEVKWALLSNVMPSWSAQSIAKCAGVLSSLATGSDALNNDLLALRLLARHRTLESKWLREWIEFKLSRLGERTHLAREVAAEILEAERLGRMPMELSAVRVFVWDIDAARVFYANVLGLTLASDGSRHGYCVFDSAGIRLVVEAVPRDAPPHDQCLVGRFAGVSFAVADIAAEHQRLLSLGVNFTGVPERQSWGGMLATFHDPSRNELNIVQYAT